MDIDATCFLENFLGGYFHQDWRLEADKPADVVERFIRETDPNTLGRTASELESYVAKYGTAPDFEKRLFSELGCDYMPSGMGQDAREWLLGVGAQLREGARKRGP